METVIRVEGLVNRFGGGAGFVMSLALAEPAGNESRLEIRCLQRRKQRLLSHEPGVPGRMRTDKQSLAAGAEYTTHGLGKLQWAGGNEHDIRRVREDL